MTAAVTKAGPYYSTGSISFSSLRSNFKETSSGTISASELKRITSTSNTNPIVPDCTENRTSGPLSNGISTENNLKLSQFRNSIKYYYITQTGTDLNFNIDSQSWNSNLNKNIVKKMYISGVCGSNSISNPAVLLNVEVYNLIIDVFGSILGAGGKGGGYSPDPAGTTISFERYYNSSTGLHFYTSNPSNEFISANQYILESPSSFYAFTTKVANTTELYRAYKDFAPAGPHILTTNKSEYDNVIAAGWDDEGIVGYVYTSSFTNTIQIYRLYNSTTGDFLYTDSSTEVSEATNSDGYTYQASSSFYSPFPEINGQPGGNALQVISSSGKVSIYVRPDSNIYGGGGGGEKGATGARGNTQSCYSTYQVTDAECNSGDSRSYSYQYSSVTGRRCWWRFCCETQCNDTYTTFTVYNCTTSSSVIGAPGGVGGNGTLGRGYNNQIASLTGGKGSLGTNGGCPTYGDTGYTGEDGGDGGDWGRNGGNTTNTGNGGPAGRAISGSNYTVNGVINLNTVRGLYNP